MVTATISEAKANLSALVKKVRGGETVMITYGRDKTPVAKLEGVGPAPKKKRLGAMYTPGFELSEAFWEPLPKGWDGWDSEDE